MDDEAVAAGLVALRDARDEGESDAANGLVALRNRNNIVFEKVEDDSDVNAVFKRYVDKTQGKVIVVAEEGKRRLAFFTKKDVRGPSGNC